MSLYQVDAAGPKTTAAVRSKYDEDEDGIRTASITCHAAGSRPFMRFGLPLFNELLRCDIAGGEEYAGGDALREKRRGTKTVLVPTVESASQR